VWRSLGRLRNPIRAVFAGFELKSGGTRPILGKDTKRGRMTPQTETKCADWLAKGGLRPTRQRLTLAGLLVGDGQDRHVTAEGLFALVGAAGEKVSLATVYNTLRAFCDAGLMAEVVVDGSKSYFDTRTDDHPHFYWEETAQLTDAPKEDLKITGLPTAPEGTEIARVDVVIRLRRR